MIDVERYPEWLIASGIVRVERLDAGPLAAGSRLRIAQTVAGRSTVLDGRRHGPRARRRVRRARQGRGRHQRRDRRRAGVDDGPTSCPPGCAGRCGSGLPLRYRMFESMVAPQARRAATLDLEALQASAGDSRRLTIRHDGVDIRPSSAGAACRCRSPATAPPSVHRDPSHGSPAGRSQARCSTRTSFEPARRFRSSSPFTAAPASSPDAPARTRGSCPSVEQPSSRPSLAGRTRPPTAHRPGSGLADPHRRRRTVTMAIPSRVARSRPSCSPAAGSSSASRSSRSSLAKVLVDAGLPGRPTLGRGAPRGPHPAAAFHRRIRRGQHLAAVGLLLERAWASGLAIATSLVAVAVGVIGLVLIAVGSDPLASTASAHASADGFGIVGLFTVLYRAIIVRRGDPRLVAARPPRGRRRERTDDRGGAAAPVRPPPWHARVRRHRHHTGRARRPRGRRRRPPDDRARSAGAVVAHPADRGLRVSHTWWRPTD